MNRRAAALLVVSSLVLPAILVLPTAGVAGPGRAAPARPPVTAWTELLERYPEAVDDPAISPLERRVLHALTPEAAEAFFAGADPATIEVRGGGTLDELLAGGETAEGELVYVPVDPCRVMATWYLDPGEPMAAGEVKEVTFKGDDLSAQGGSATGCGIGEEAVAVAVAIRVSQPDDAGQLKMWASDLPEPETPILDYFDSPSIPKFNTGTLLQLCAAECAGDAMVKAASAGAHVRLDAVGYFRAGDGGGGGGDPVDADTLDGLDSTDFALDGHVHAGEEIVSGTVAEARIDAALARDVEVFGLVTAADGTGSGLDADLLDGRDADDLRSKIANVVVVSSSGGDFDSIQAAIDSITDAGPGNRYLVRVGPGTYFEAVTLKPFVDVEGAGQEVTTIAFDSADATLRGADDAELRHLSVANSGGGAAARAIQNNDTSPVLRWVTARASGASANSAVWNNGPSAAPRLEGVTARASGGAEAVAVLNLAAAPVIHHSTLVGDSDAVRNNGATAEIVHTQLVGGASGGGLTCLGAFDASFVELGTDCQ